MTEIEIQKHGFGSTPWLSKLQVVARAQWPTTYQSSYLQRYKTGSQDSQRIQSIPGEISVPNSLTTSRGLLRNLELNGISVGSTRRKANPSENSPAVHQEEELYPQRQ